MGLEGGDPRHLSRFIILGGDFAGGLYRTEEHHSGAIHGEENKQANQPAMSSVFNYDPPAYSLDPEADGSTVGKIMQMQQLPGGTTLRAKFIDPTQVASGQQETIPGTFTFQGTGSQTGEFGGLTFKAARIGTQVSNLPASARGQVVHLLIEGGPSTVDLAAANNHLETTTPLPENFRPQQATIVGTAQIIDNGSFRRELVMSVNPNGIVDIQPNEADQAGPATLTTCSVSYFLP